MLVVLGVSPGLLLAASRGMDSSDRGRGDGPRGSAGVSSRDSRSHGDSRRDDSRSSGRSYRDDSRDRSERGRGPTVNSSPSSGRSHGSPSYRGAPPPSPRGGSSFRGHGGYSSYRPSYRPYVPVRRSSSWSSVIFGFDWGYRPPVIETYEVIERPVIIERPVVIERDVIVDREIGRDYPDTSRPVEASGELLEVWLGDESFLLDHGEYFRRGSEGLIWIPTPVGALVSALPIGVNTVWHEDNEYLEFDGGYFRRSPDGFKVVNPPWVDSTRGDEG